MTGDVYRFKPLIWITIKDARGVEHERSALIDTGYMGGLSIPLADAQNSFSLKPLNVKRELNLANGARVDSEAFEAEIRSPSGKWRRILVDTMSDEVIVGMDYLKDHVLILDMTGPGQDTNTAGMFEDAVFVGGASLLECLRHLCRKWPKL